MMNKEERFVISVNQEDVQNIIDCYEKDIKYIKELEQRIDKAIEYIENSYYSKNTTNIESIGYTTNKLLRIREILGGKE